MTRRAYAPYLPLLAADYGVLPPDIEHLWPDELADMIRGSLAARRAPNG